MSHPSPLSPELLDRLPERIRNAPLFLELTGFSKKVYLERFIPWDILREHFKCKSEVWQRIRRLNKDHRGIAEGKPIRGLYRKPKADSNSFSMPVHSFNAMELTLTVLCLANTSDTGGIER